jgi:hypothetical protein
MEMVALGVMSVQLFDGDMAVVDAGVKLSQFVDLVAYVGLKGLGVGQMTKMDF